MFHPMYIYPSKVKFEAQHMFCLKPPNQILGKLFSKEVAQVVTYTINLFSTSKFRQVGGYFQKADYGITGESHKFTRLRNEMDSPRNPSSKPLHILTNIQRSLPLHKKLPWCSWTQLPKNYLNTNNNQLNQTQLKFVWRSQGKVAFSRCYKLLKSKLAGFKV